MLAHLSKEKLRCYVEEFCRLEGYTGIQLCFNHSMLMIINDSTSLADNNPSIQKLYDQFNTWVIPVRRKDLIQEITSDNNLKCFNTY